MRFAVRKRAGIWAGLLVVSGLVMGQTAMATPLGLDLLPLGLGADPDINAGFGSVSYTATTGSTDTLTLTAQPTILFTGGVSHTIVAGLTDLVLSANIDDLGNLVDGTLVISGTVGSPLNFTSGTLLTATLTKLGFGGAGSLLEWEFSVTGGDAAGLWGDSPGGIILGGSGFGGDWLSSFSASFTASMDVGVIPEPSTALLLGLGLMGLALRGRRQA